MASIKTWSTFKGTPRPEGLCPTCFNPALKLYFLQEIDIDGITPLGERIMCRDCRIWIEPTRMYTHG